MFVVCVFVGQTSTFGVCVCVCVSLSVCTPGFCHHQMARVWCGVCEYAVYLCVNMRVWV
jgi:hypothetical protein